MNNGNLYDMSTEDILTHIANTMYEEPHKGIQEQLLKAASTSIRKSKKNSELKFTGFNHELLMKYKAFIVPNNVFLYDIFGGVVRERRLDLYHGDTCIFAKRLVIPLWGFDGKVKSFVGYDNGDEQTPEELINFVSYQYQQDFVFEKKRLWLMTTEEYKMAFERGYIFIVDGLFDKFTIWDMGEPATSLLSSNLTSFHKKYLRYIPNWIVVSDNDEAGEKLYARCKLVNPRTTRVFISHKYKDIDERVRQTKDGVAKFKRCVDNLSRTNHLISINMEKDLVNKIG